APLATDFQEAESGAPHAQLDLRPGNPGRRLRGADLDIPGRRLSGTRTPLVPSYVVPRGRRVTGPFFRAPRFACGVRPAPLAQAQRWRVECSLFMRLKAAPIKSALVRTNRDRVRWLPNPRQRFGVPNRWELIPPATAAGAPAPPQR